MATLGVKTISAVRGSVENQKVQRAIISVFDKTGIEALAKYLSSLNVEILSTGGTYKTLQNCGINVKEVSDYTSSSEVFDGRVKTLHPKIHGGLLFVRGNQQHEKEAEEHNILRIDLVVCNLYPFEKTVSSGADFFSCIENIDIGGPCLIRAGAKNNASVCVVSSPFQYNQLIECLKINNGCTTPYLRKMFAAEAFNHTSQYENLIAEYFNKEAEKEKKKTEEIKKIYKKKIDLKYGCNPHQLPAAICSIGNNELPFRILNGSPGYINMLDAVYAWQLVKELKESTGYIASASFKHCSPAGAALGFSLTDHEKLVFDIPLEKDLSLTACAYIRARNGDPLCSFGDFSSLSDEVDEKTAEILKNDISDGIIAPHFTDDALKILKTKKSGNFLILEANPLYIPPEMEYREIFGMVYMQKRNDVVFSSQHLANIKTNNKIISEDAKLDLILASITTKYTQSNSVSYALNKQIIGVGAGQQSRIDCVKLAGRKVVTWYLRHHPKVIGLKFKKSVKRQQRINARIQFIEGAMTETEYEIFKDLLIEVPSNLTAEEKNDFLKNLKDVCMSSDAFFPFRDNIDTAAKYGVKYIAHPGGSVQDEEVINAANGYDMVILHTNLRLFLH